MLPLGWIRSASTKCKHTFSPIQAAQCAQRHKIAHVCITQVLYKIIYVYECRKHNYSDTITQIHRHNIAHMHM